MSALTEKDIIEAVRKGRREGQTEMVGRYAQRVFAMIARQVPDVMDAPDALLLRRTLVGRDSLHYWHRRKSTGQPLVQNEKETI